MVTTCTYKNDIRMFDILHFCRSHILVLQYSVFPQFWVFTSLMAIDYVQIPQKLLVKTKFISTMAACQIVDYRRLGVIMHATIIKFPIEKLFLDF